MNSANQTKEQVKAKADPFYYRHRETIVGLFVAVPLIIIPLLCIFLLVKTEFWERYEPLHLKCKESTGLAPGSNVYILGALAGHVDNVYITNEGFLDIKIKVKRKYSHLVHKDSQAKIGQKNFVMEWRVDILPGSDFYPPIADNDTILATVPVRMEDMAEKLIPIVEPISEIATHMSNGDGILRYLLGRDTIDRQLSMMLETGNKALGSTGAIIARVNKTLGKADKMIADFDEFGHHGTSTIDSFMVLSHRADTLVWNLDSLAFSLDSVSHNLNTVPPEINSTMVAVKKDVVDAELLLHGLQKHWLLRRSIRKAQLEADSTKK